MITTTFQVVEPDAKFATLLGFLRHHREEKILVFLSTCACVDYFSRLLRQLLPRSQSQRLLALHGKMKKKRTAVFTKFRNESV